MDFLNEALNAQRMERLLGESDFAPGRLVIPQPHLALTTRRVLVMEWVTGVKLASLPAAEIRALVKVGQEAFLTQLLDIGAQPWPRLWPCALRLASPRPPPLASRRTSRRYGCALNSP